MQVDYLIIGQGISGSCLSYFLSEANASFLVIDDSYERSPSRAAAGLINPVTGRRIVRSWRVEEFMPFSKNCYSRMGEITGVTGITEKKILDFFPNPQMKLAFEERRNEGELFLTAPLNENDWLDSFQYSFGYGIIEPAYTVHLSTLLPAWQLYLTAKGQLKEERFEHTELILTADGISYKDITAAKIIFCDGAAAADSVYFNRLPFALTKGEALILEIPDLSPEFIYKRSLSLVPLPEKNRFWLGSSNAWTFDHDQPEAVWREEACRLLQSWLKMPFKITDHKAALRPATVERRPFVGFHPVYNNAGLLNGMGTKGCSLAPWFSRELCDHLLYGKPISAEADVQRFTKILSR